MELLEITKTLFLLVLPDIIFLKKEQCIYFRFIYKYKFPELNYLKSPKGTIYESHCLRARALGTCLSQRQEG